MFRTEAIIDSNNLIHNLNYIKNQLDDNVLMMPVVKANGYGHGDVEICKILSKNNVDGFCVALIDEVIDLRKNNIKDKILHLGCFEHIFHKIMLDKNLILTLNTIDDVFFLEEIGQKYNHKFNVHIKLDTGMVRLGFLKDEIQDLSNILTKSSNIIIDGIYTQLSSADENDQIHTDKQRQLFINISNFLEQNIGKIKHKHITPSAGILKDKKNHFDLVRPGISLYGICNVNEKHNLKPVMKVVAPVLIIKNIEPGSTIGYNRTFNVNKKIKIAILQTGYADVVPLNFSNKGYVEFNNFKLNILGKVSMDLLCIDVTNVNIKIGDKVTIFGGDLTRLEDITNKSKNSSYSILTNITKRVRRLYV